MVFENTGMRISHKMQSLNKFFNFASGHCAITDQQHAFILFEEIFKDSRLWLGENLFLLTLDPTHQLLDIHHIASGTRNKASFRLNTIYSIISESYVSGIYLAHNHPDFIAIPSILDREATSAIKRISDKLGVELKDHFIIGRKTHMSFKNWNLL